MKRVNSLRDASQDGSAIGPEPLAGSIIGATAGISSDETLGDRVYAAIFDEIVRGDLKPGSRLPSESILAERHTVSRPIVREALARLRDHGLIYSRQGSGSFVRQRPDQAVLRFAPVANIADIQRCFEFRASFEGRAAALAAERREPSHLKRIKACYDELEHIIKQGSLGVDEDFAFHLAVAAAARNHFFTSTLAMLEEQIRFGMNLMRNLSLQRSSERLHLVQEEHRLVLEAVTRGDAVAAQAAMIYHVDHARKRMFEGSVDGVPSAEASSSINLIIE